MLSKWNVKRRDKKASRKLKESLPSEYSCDGGMNWQIGRGEANNKRGFCIFKWHEVQRLPTEINVARHFEILYERRCFFN